MRIGIDLMGSEKAPREYFDAILEIAQELDPSDRLVVFATESVAEAFPSTPSLPIEFHIVREVIEMDDDPLAAVRRKRDSSLVVGVKFINEKKIDAFISAGNTGALVASCTLTLPLFPGIKRPALLASLPKKTGALAVLDVGGHVSYKAEHLIQFAYLGAAFQRAAKDVEVPSVGLLNIGTETSKGTQEIQKAHQLLLEEASKHRCHFVGNIEGREVFQSPVDVLVTDGFTGNVFLKTAEGLSSYLFDTIGSSLGKEAQKEIADLRRKLSRRSYPGALVCGVEGVVIKCHGASSSKDFYSSFLAATSFVRASLVEKMKGEFSE